MKEETVRAPACVKASEGGRDGGSEGEVVERQADFRLAALSVLP